MLRASLRSSRPLLTSAARSRVATQWQIAHRHPQASSLVVAGQRWLADNKKPETTVFPGTESKLAAKDVGSPPGLTPSNPALASDIPTPPPVAPEAKVVSELAAEKAKATTTASTIPPTGTGTASVASPPPPPPKKRRFFRFLVWLTLLSSLGYGGGVYYSLVSDDFHDLFTEYVPFGEDAVGFFEEREFKRRFPGKTPPSRLQPQVRGEEKVRIPSKSGISSMTVKEERASDLGSSGKHMSAVEDAKSKPQSTPAPPPIPAAKTESPKDSHTHDLLPKAAPQPEKPSTPAPKAEPKAEPKTEPKPVVAPATQIDNLKVDGASEAVVQDVVKIINDIITVVNADNAAGKYSSSINKAKDDLGKVISDLTNLKEVEKKAAADQIKAAHLEFDEAAKELVIRLEREMHEQEAHFREAYEAERERLSQSYQQKLRSEVDATEKVFDQKLKNQLLQQSIQLQQQFTDSLRDRVEKEREGRLSKLNELSSSVQELEKLTGEWNSVIDANLRTQHLIVAVEAVRATLENADRPRPFVVELAALKEVAADDAVVNAAIASINPSAYQRGIPTASQLIDRFRRVASEVRKAALLPENAGVASHLASAVLSKVMFKKQGLPVGDDVESVLTRTEILLEEGDLDGATREMNALNGWAKLLARDWVSDCRKVLEVRQALDVITTEARLQSLLVD